MRYVGEYKYQGFGGYDSKCHLDIYNNLVICTEYEDNEGTSITNMAEQLATMVCRDFDISHMFLIWIECYDILGMEKTCELVQFNLHDNIFSNPRWVRINQEVVDALKLMKLEQLDK